MSTAAILDTNVIVQALIGSRRGASSRTLVAYGRKRFQLVFSLATLEELDTVLNLPAMRSRHGLADRRLNQFYTFLLANSVIHAGSEVVAVSLARDITDTKFLSLAQQS